VQVLPVVDAPPARRIRDDLNGLRGLAIALVVVYHVYFGRVSGGVDVFLVLSGYFFGSRLLRMAADGQRPALHTEVTRLLRRLLPALVVVLAAGAALTVLVQPQTRWEEFANQGLASLGYYQNWYLASTVNDYLRAGEAVSPLQHIWSMSVQGQFFLAILLVAWLIALVAGRRRRPVLISVIALGTVASFTYAVTAHNMSQSTAYYDSFARAWELLIGMLAAALPATLVSGRWRAVAAVLGLAGILACGIVLDGAAQFPGPWALLPVGATLLVILSDSGANTTGAWPNRILGAPVLVTLGAMAYALYLWHWPLLIFWLAYSGRDGVGIAEGAAVMAVSAVLAYLTLRLVEDPLRRGTPKPEEAQTEAAKPVTRRRRIVLLGTCVILLAVALTMTSLLWRQHVAVVRASGSELAQLSMRDYPGAHALLGHTKVAKLPMRPTVFEAPDDLPAPTVDGCITDFPGTEIIKCSYGDRNASRSIALAGGSHAEHWIGALDILGRNHGFRVDTFLKMGCALTLDDPSMPDSEHPYPQCREWVYKTLDTIIAERPDFVFTNTTRPRTDGPGDMVPEAYVRVWEELNANGVAVLGIRDTPWMLHDGMLVSPVDCLSDGGDPDSCGVPRREALSDYDPARDYDDDFPLLHLLDLSDAICRMDTCSAVEGNVLVYRDSHHLTQTYVRTLADELGRQISEATGFF